MLLLTLFINTSLHAHVNCLWMLGDSIGWLGDSNIRGRSLLAVIKKRRLYSSSAFNAYRVPSSEKFRRMKILYWIELEGFINNQNMPLKWNLFGKSVSEKNEVTFLVWFSLYFISSQVIQVGILNVNRNLYSVNHTLSLTDFSDDHSKKSSQALQKYSSIMTCKNLSDVINTSFSCSWNNMLSRCSKQIFLL